MSHRRRLMMQGNSQTPLIDYFDGYKAESLYDYNVKATWKGCLLELSKMGGGESGDINEESIANPTSTYYVTWAHPEKIAIGYDPSKKYNLRIKVVSKDVVGGSSEGTLQFVFYGYGSSGESISKESEIIKGMSILPCSEFIIPIDTGEILNSLCFKFEHQPVGTQKYDAYYFSALFAFYFEEITE